MKLKTLVSSMVALGLASTAAHALPRKPQSVNTKVSSLTARVNALESIVKRNQDNAANDPKSLLDSDWYKNITISGEFQPVLGFNNRSNLDTQNRTNTTFLRNEHTTFATMNTMELYIDGQVNSFTKVHAGLDYDNNWDNYSVLDTNGTEIFVPGRELFFSEANIQFSNFAKSGLYATLGKQFFNFGSYQHDSITTPLTEMLSKTNGVGATTGYVSKNGFNVDGYLFGGALGKRSDAARNQTGNAIHSSRLRTWGASAGYTMKSRTFGLSAQLGYINNMAQTIYLSHAINGQHNREAINNPGNFERILTYYQRTPGMSLHLDLSSGPFDLIFDYVGAMKRFAAEDLATESAVGSPAKGAKLSATFTQLDYKFRAFRHASTAYVAYQSSEQAQGVYGIGLGGFMMPKSSMTAGYEYYLAKNTALNLEVDHYKDYKIANTTGGSSRTGNSVVLGLAVKF